MDENKATEPVAHHENELKSAIMERPEMKGLSWDDIKTGLNRLIPLLEVAVKMTENPYDDLALDFLKKIII